MPPCNCHPPFPRPEPFSPLPRPGKIPDWGKWIRDRLSEKGALLVFPTRAMFPEEGAWPNLYLDRETGAVYRWENRTGYVVLVDPREGDDVLVYDSVAAFPDEGEQGKLYIAANTGSLHRWGGGGYIALLPGKADKAVPQTAGNFAALTQDGNLADSRTKPDDFATAAQGAKADTAVQPAAIAGFVDGAEYDAEYGDPPKPTILLKHGDEVVATVDAADFVIDGMVSDVKIENGNLVIAFNTDSGKQPISIPLTDIFNPDNYYTKTDVNGLLAGKASKSDATLTEKWTPTFALTDAQKEAFSQTPGASDNDYALTIVPPTSGESYTLYVGSYNAAALRKDPSNITNLILTGGDARLGLQQDDIVATLSSYQLGSQTDKPLASEAEAEALRTGKADKPSTFTTGNLAKFDSDGNPTDSGKKPSDFQSALSAQQIANIAAVPNKATKADATLTERFSAWTIEFTDPPADYLEPTYDGAGHWHLATSNASYTADGSLDATSLDFSDDEGGQETAHATRTALSGYQLGSQTDKPLASEADATLTERGFSDWVCVPSTYDGHDITIDASPHYAAGMMDYTPYADGEQIGMAFTATEDATYIHWESPNSAVVDIVATRTALQGYRLGPDEQTNPNRDKPLASEAEAEALRTDKLDKSGGTFGATTISLSDEGIVVSDTQSSNLTLLSSSYNFLTHRDGLGVRYFAAPSTSGTLALTAANPTAGNLAALDASGNPTNSGVKASDKLDSTSAAPAFSTSSTYAVGEHVTYNGGLYRCTTAVTAAGAWDASKWTADTMTDPDAVLDITAQNQLRVVAKDGTLLWAQGYDLASTSSATLACDAVNNFTFADGATTQAFTLPTAPTGKVGDFGLDIDNSANTGAATLTLTGLDTTFSVVVPKGESLNDMLAIAAGELARFYISLSTFRVNNLPTWHIVKQIVENGGAQS